MSVVLTDAEAILYFTEIASATRSFAVEDEVGTQRRGVLQQPTPLQRRVGAETYRETYEVCLKEGIRTRKQLETDFLERYQPLTDQEQATLRRLEGQRAVIEKKILRSGSEPLLLRQQREELEKVNVEYYSLLSKRTNYYTSTAEYQAERSEMIYYAECCATDVWPTPAGFRNETDRVLIERMVNHLAGFIRGFDQGTLRALARSPVVRTRWRVSNKTGSPFFGIPMAGGQAFFARPTADFTQDQINLCSWLMYYDDVSQAFEAPEWILNDDDKLDKWVEKKVQEREAERLKRVGSSGKTGHDHQDVIVFDEDREFMFAEGSPHREAFARKVKAAERTTGTTDQKNVAGSRRL
jgi:hypothetical protein